MQLAYTQNIHKNRYIVTTQQQRVVVQASFLMQRPVGNRFLIQPLTPTEPAKDCMVCGTAQLQLALNTASMTLAHFISKVCT